ncbi:hypothetical protein ElyMa_004200800 [Elysia marginata]|uniref:Uncharacterized protein n=1 Tax=Elysia marginata TaxID=1093978 RepID=A0AAV4GLU4_9GAST|nr:hypothetical protein ElyMa_004200800 [Elysia marginata]
MPRAFLITHKRRFEEGSAALLQDTTSDQRSWVEGKIEGECEVLKESNSSSNKNNNNSMLEHTVVAYGGGSSSGSTSGDSGVGSPPGDVGKLPDSPRRESALAETPTSLLGKCS